MFNIGNVQKEIYPFVSNIDRHLEGYKQKAFMYTDNNIVILKAEYPKRLSVYIHDKKSLDLIVLSILDGHKINYLIDTLKDEIARHGLIYVKEYSVMGERPTYKIRRASYGEKAIIT